MKIAKKIKTLFCNSLITDLPDESITEKLCGDAEINYDLLQRYLIKSHLKAFTYHSLMLESAVKTGCLNALEVANKGLSLHSKQISSLSGMGYFADVNAAASRLEREGYSVSSDPE
jgi:hypothetical protein